MELATGELGRAPLGQVESTDGVERLVRPRPDLGRRHPEVLEPESDLVPHECHHDLVLGVLKTAAVVPASTAGRDLRVSIPATSTLPAKRPPWK